jgi:HEAT repeat protein
MTSIRTAPAPEEIINSARELLAAGKTDDARELLLENGYVTRSEPTIQKAYLHLVPVSATLRAVLDEVYVGLGDRDPKVRFDAASKLVRECTKAYPRDNVRWMRDPRASEPLIHAVQDPDTKVSERALRALSCLVCKYFRDQRALPAFVAKLSHAKQDTRNNAISGVGCMGLEEGLEHLINLNDHGTERDRAEVARQIAALAYASEQEMNQYYYMKWTEAGREFWKGRMVAALRDPFADVRKQAALALKAFGDRKTLPALRAARHSEQDDNLFFFLDDAITALEKSA